MGNDCCYSRAESSGTPGAEKRKPRQVADFPRLFVPAGERVMKTPRTLSARAAPELATNPPETQGLGFTSEVGKVRLLTGETFTATRRQ
jgi:hypothetical protein